MHFLVILAIFSGITPQALKILKDNYPGEFQLFKQTITVTEENKWIGKGDRAFYELCDHIIRQDHPNADLLIVFIDDKDTNCQLGIKQGWTVELASAVQSCIAAIQKHFS